jgi:cytochrome c-type biogenesis protein CcmF
MIAEVGHFLLILAFTLSFVSFLSTNIRNDSVIRMALSLNFYSSVSIIFSCFCLVYSFVCNDFSLLYVANNSSLASPLFYKLCALWAGYSGSMLVFLLCISLWKLLGFYVCKNQSSDFMRYFSLLYAFLEISLFIFIIFFSNPFERSLPTFPLDGRGINPALYSPMLLIHSILILVGYSGTSLPSMYILSKILAKQDSFCIRIVYKPILAIWLFLTLGIVSGCWWAYNSVGWGGLWFWDPVQNTALMGWLLFSGLVHISISYIDTSSCKKMLQILSFMPFYVCLFSMAVIRSGILLSIHGFSVDYSSGVFLISVFVINLGLALAIYLYNLNEDHQDEKITFMSRDFLIFVSCLLILFSVFCIFLATIFPLIYRVLFGENIYIGSPYFEHISYFYLVAMLALIVAVPYSKYKGTTRISLVVSAVFSLLLLFSITYYITDMSIGFGFLLFLLLWIIISHVFSILYFLGCSCSGFVTDEVPKWIMLFSHLGLSLLLLGILVVNNFSYISEFSLDVGGSKNIHGSKFFFNSSEVTEYKNFTKRIFNVGIMSEDNSNILSPSIVSWKSSHFEYPLIATKKSLFNDMQIFVEKKISKNTWLFHFTYLPFSSLIWGGTMVLIIAVIVAMFSRNKREII